MCRWFILSSLRSVSDTEVSNTAIDVSMDGPVSICNSFYYSQFTISSHMV